MPSTFSTNLGIELITTGEQAGTWGATTNTNLGTLIEQAISGYVAQVITDGADTVITIPSGSTGVARNMTLELTGALSAARNLIVPSNRKLYFIYNNTTGGYAVTVKVSGQTGVSVPNGAKVLLVSNGTDVVNAVNYIPALYFSAGTAAAPSISTIGDTNTGIYFPAADNISLTTSGTQRVTLDSSGRLGLGTGSPVGKFQINDGSGRNVIVTTDATQIGTSGMAVGSFNDNASAYAPLTLLGSALHLATGGLERARIDASGNLGIGTSSPSGKLEVRDTNATGVFSNSSTRYGFVQWENTGGEFRIGTDGAFGLRFDTNAQRKMTLDSTGNLGLGDVPPPNTTYPGLFLQNSVGLIPYNGDGYLFYNAYSVGTNQLRYRSSGLAATAYAFNQSGEHIWYNAPSGTAGTAVTFSERMRITSSGSFLVGTTTNNHGSLAEFSKPGNVDTQVAIFSTGLTGTARLALLNGDNNVAIGVEGPGNLVFYAASRTTERARITPEGNFGLGVTPSAWGPAFKNIDINSWSSVGGTSGGSYLTYNSFYNAAASWVYKTTAPAGYYGIESNVHKWYNAPSGTAGTAITFTQAMTLDAAGNLGLGLTPSAWSGQKAIQLAVGSGFISSSDSAFRFYAGTNAYYNGSNWIYKASSLASLYEQADSIHRWYTAPSGTAGTAITFTQAMTLDASGNLGLGVTPSAWSGGFKAIQFPGGSVAGFASSTNLQIEIGTAYYQSSLGTYTYFNTGTAPTIYRQIGGDHRWYTAPSGTAGNTISFTQAMTLDASGKLRIGTTSGTGPVLTGGLTTTSTETELFIGRSGAVESSSVGDGASIQLQNITNTTSCIIQQYSNNLQFFNYTGGSWTERARITSDGNFLVGTTSSDTTAASVIIERSGATASTGAYLVIKNQNSSQSTNGALTPAGGILFSTYRDIRDPSYTAGITCTARGVNGTNTGAELIFRTASAGGYNFANEGNSALPDERARITSDGNFLVGTTSAAGAGGFTVYNNGSTGFSIVNNNNAAATGYVFQSFRRSSVEVGSVTQNGTTGVLYNTTSDLRLKDNITPAPSASDDIDAIQIVSHDWKAAPDEHVKYGVIAQDLNSVAPQAVFQGDDGEEVEKAWGVDYSKLVPMLIKEIQSLRARVAALESN
jgi:hypothetical protein